MPSRTGLYTPGRTGGGGSATPRYAYEEAGGGAHMGGCVVAVEKLERGFA